VRWFRALVVMIGGGGYRTDPKGPVVEQYGGERTKQYNWERNLKSRIQKGLILFRR